MGQTRKELSLRGIHNKSYINQHSFDMLSSVAQGHTFDLLAESAPVVGLELAILDALLTPVLVQTADMEHGGLEECDFVTEAFLDEDPARVLVDDGLLVLQAH